MPADAAHDRNLLFGILALQLDFITRDQLVEAMNAWVLEKAKPVGQILLQKNVLGESSLLLLDALVNEHVRRHLDDPHRSLACLSSADNAREALAQVKDPVVEASLGVVGSLNPAAHDAHDPHATRDEAPTIKKLTQPVEDSKRARDSFRQRFRILRPHARGGLGAVFVARDEELGREVALKEIQSQHADDPTSRQRFLLEAEITGGLEHPGIVPVYGLGTYADGRPYYAMRFIRGDSLKEAIDRFHAADVPDRDPTERNLSLRQLLRRFIDVCNAIDYAHHKGVLHRDLKPGNIMLGKYGETLVVDWGLAKPKGIKEGRSPSPESMLVPASSSGSQETMPGSAVGTPAYMSPEQAEGRLEDLGAASDVYSLGATLYSLLAGVAPFQGRDVFKILADVKAGNFQPPRKVKPSAPAALSAICVKAMALKAEDRYGSALEMAEDVEHWLADEPTVAYRETKLERAARFARRHRSWVQAVGAALLLVTVTSVVSTFMIQNAREREGRAYRLENLQREFSIGVEHFTWDKSGKLEGMLTEWETLAPEAGAEARQRYLRRVAEAIETELSAPTLSPEELSAIDAHLAYLAPRDRVASDRLRVRREERARQWERVFTLAEPFKNLGEVMKPAQVRVEAKSLLPQIEAMPPFVATQKPCPGAIRMRGVFSDWDSAPVLGLMLNHGVKQRYQFLVSVPKYDPRSHDDDFKRLATLAQQRNDGEPMRIQILRDGISLRQTTVNIPTGSLELKAERQGDKLIFQVNRMPPLEFDDPFPLSSQDTGSFALYWPAGVKLELLEGEKQALPPRASPLEKADELFASGKFTDSLTLYQEQARIAKDKDIEQRARYQQALCLDELGRPDEAMSALQELSLQVPAVATPGKGEWAIRAACKLWLLYLEKNRSQDADRLLEQLSPAYTFDKLAPLIPDHVRVTILDSFRSRGPIWNSAFEYKKNVERMERAARVEDLLDESPQERRLTRWRLMAAYRVNQRLPSAIRIGEELLDDRLWPGVAPQEKAAVFREFAWTLIEDGQAARALVEVNKLLEGEMISAYRPLLIERARIQAALGHHELAEKDVERFFAEVPKEQLDYAEYSDACLLRGFLRKHRGDEEGAKAAWALGLPREWPGGLPPPPRDRLLTIRAFVNRSNAITFAGQLASLLQILTKEEAASSFFSITSSTGTKAAVIRTLGKRHFPPEFMRAVMLEIYNTPRAHEIVRRMTFRQIDFRGFYVDPFFLSLHAACRVGAYEGEISVEHEALIWKGVRDALEHFESYKLDDESMEQIVQLWIGKTDPQPIWRSASPLFDQELRLSMGLLFGYRQLWLKQPDRARPFFEELIERAMPSSQVYNMARSELDKLNKNAAPK